MLPLATNSVNQSHSTPAPGNRRLLARGLRVVLFALSLLGTSTTVSLTFADEDDDGDVVVAAVVEEQFVFTQQQFDQTVFGGGARAAQVVREANGVKRIEMVTTQTATAFRERLESALATEIQALDTQWSLTATQKKKLGLAGKGDIHQFFSRVAELRAKLTTAPMSRERYTELITALQPLGMIRQHGLIAENSLFRKTLRKTLTDEQAVRYLAYERQQQSKAVENVLANWDRLPNTVRLSGDNRKKFIEVLVEHGHLPVKPGPYIQYVVLFETGRLEDRVREVLTADEWDKLRAQVTQAKRHELAVRNAGEWPLSDPDEAEAPDSEKR